MEQLKAASVSSATSAKVSLSMLANSSRSQVFVYVDWLSYDFEDQHLTARSPYEDLSLYKDVLAVNVCVCVFACSSLP